MFDLLYFTSCCPAPNVQHSVLVFGDPEQDIYLCQFLENHIVLDSHLTGRFIEHPRGVVEAFILENYGCFDCKRYYPESIDIDKLPW